jgi:hypothetical protein
MHVFISSVCTAIVYFLSLLLLKMPANFGPTRLSAFAFTPVRQIYSELHYFALFFLFGYLVFAEFK